MLIGFAVNKQHLGVLSVRVGKPRGTTHLRALSNAAQLIYMFAFLASQHQLAHSHDQQRW